MEEKTKVLIVGVNVNHDPDFENGLLELENLAEACDMEVVGVETQNISQVHTGVYIGKGKVEEIKALAHMLDVEMVIFSQSLSPMQLRNLNQLLERSVIDRTSLILEIFPGGQEPGKPRFRWKQPGSSMNFPDWQASVRC